MIQLSFVSCCIEILQPNERVSQQTIRLLQSDPGGSPRGREAQDLNTFRMHDISIEFDLCFPINNLKTGSREIA
jgi:hypothetical protein